MPDRTMFAAVRQVPPSGPGAPASEPFADRLRAAVARAVETAPRPTVVALSGGLDSAVLFALVREIDPSIKPFILEPNLPGYSEVTEARATAKLHGSELFIFPAPEGAFASAVRDVLECFETPLYNLHPISKWILAAGCKHFGIASVISGDGADQVFRHDTTADYLPLVGAAFDSHDVKLCAPFLDIGSVECDPDKHALRELASTLLVRDVLVHGPKVSRLAPPVAFEAPIERLADMLGKTYVDLSDDRARVRWGTLAVLVDIFEAWT
jgi:hypothetical protein